MDYLVAKMERALPRKKIDIFGQDSLINSSIPYYTLALLSTIGIVAKQPNPFVLIAIVYTFFPLIDEIFILDLRNPT